MKQYTLFLDEIHTGGHFDHFSLVGLAVANEDYEKKLIPMLERLKYDFFNDKSVIIHEKDINDARGSTPFRVFQNREKKEEFWTRIAALLVELNPPIFAVCVHERKYSQMYGRCRDGYAVALQIILENFIHFLDKNDGFGTVFVESSNPLPQQKDQQLQQHFYHLKANGTLFYDRTTFQSRVGTINFPLKADNIPGLQLADLLPNSLNRKLTAGYVQRTGNLISVIEQLLYTGYCDQTATFGLRIVP
ncbi:DUF3800 domain-containing protein [Paenibacillus koleovorans]|uniref:DUF3800 domain-containing protein n=1 Tax=Paenibacillus koleovorans TaxID=121608 RepID=UPI000FDC5BD2|nr:DUF3800 domain-containing protein [Paenibacillus koleovorans]